jgi:FkbM family methyltransferase
MSRTSAAPAIPFTVIVPTVFGQMMVNRHDIYQTNPLFKTGFPTDHREIAMLAQILNFLGTNLTVLDVGANFGTYSLALSGVVGLRGKVHAFEPQRLIFNLLVGTVAINSLTNVHCHNIALGDHEGRIEVPQFDYNQPMNFGSIEFAPEQSEQLPQARGRDPEKIEYVPLKTLDSFEFPSVNLIKIDAEGMEPQIIRGGAQTIRRCRPVMYIEFMKCDRESLRQAITEFDYAVENVGLNFLCVPRELSSQLHLKSPAQTAAPVGATA